MGTGFLDWKQFRGEPAFPNPRPCKLGAPANRIGFSRTGIVDADVPCELGYFVGLLPLTLYSEPSAVNSAAYESNLSTYLRIHFSASALLRLTTSFASSNELQSTCPL